MKLLQELFAQGFLSEERMNDLEKQAEKTGQPEEEVILSKNIVSEDFLFALKSKISGTPLKKINAEDVSPDVLELIPEEASVNYKMISLEKATDKRPGSTGNYVQIGMVYPENIAAQNALRFLANQEHFTYQVYLITPSLFEKLLKVRKNLKLETKKVLGGFEGGLDDFSGKVSGVPQKGSINESIADEAPIKKMVAVLLRHAMEEKASDIHIEPGRDKLNVRFRLNGILYPSLSLPLKVHPALTARIKILAGLKIDENRLPQDGRFSMNVDGKDIDFRVSTFITLYGEKVEIRILDPSTGLKTFEELGMTKRGLDIIKAAIKKPNGMILFTGPTGSGKTTTQYAILRILNNDSVNIVTVEDPIEYSISGINQSQVKPEIGYTFANGLRQILRQDPNVIMVGEIRDEETAGLAINAALTGHIVLSTLHTNSSVGVLPRLIDLGVRPFLIPYTVRVVISQRLIRTLCPHCKIKIKPTDKIRSYILSSIKDVPLSARPKEYSEIKPGDTFYIYEAKGCEACGFTGYLGRMGLYEVLSMSDAIAELIQKNDLEESGILKIAQKQGMLSMEQEGILKVLKGETTIEEITRVTEEK